MSNSPLHIAIVVGEISGDFLGAQLIAELQQRVPGVIFSGIAGPKMQQLGMESLYPMEKLSLIGFSEIFRHIPELLKMRRQIVRHYLQHPPDVFIGIDAPEFNLGLEKQLKQAGIPTIHYVAPTIWALRTWRWRKIKKAADLVLALFPFEVAFYQQFGIPARFVGHPLADAIPMHSDKQAARQALDLPLDKKIIALLPGSRKSELENLSECILGAAHYCWQHRNDVFFVAPLPTPETYEHFSKIIRQLAPDLPIKLVSHQATEVMAAADVVLLKSGTATLECALVKRPMVVTYKVSALTYWVAKRLTKLPWISLPNILSGREVVPELIQENATAEKLAQAVLDLLDNEAKQAELNTVFTQLHNSLKCAENNSAGQVVMEFLGW